MTVLATFLIAMTRNQTKSRLEKEGVILAHGLRRYIHRGLAHTVVGAQGTQ